MNAMEARFCVLACARYLRRRDDSPRVAQDLFKAVEVLIGEAIKQAAEAKVSTLSPTDESGVEAVVIKVKGGKASVVTNKEFWQAVYLAAIAAGKESWQARENADMALQGQPK